MGTFAGVRGYRAHPTRPCTAGSGTTMRLLLGLLAGQKLEATLTGDASLSRRPMARVTTPLKTLGATFTGPDDRAPLNLQGGRIVNCTITSTVASAQVKTAVMLAAIQGKGTLTYTEPALSRDHERLLAAMGVAFDRTSKNQEPTPSHS